MGILPTVRSTHIVEEADADPHVSVYSGLKEEHVVKASALLRLYCALMGIAGLKYLMAFMFLVFVVAVSIQLLGVLGSFSLSFLLFP